MRQQCCCWSFDVNIIITCEISKVSRDELTPPNVHVVQLTVVTDCQPVSLHIHYTQTQARPIKRRANYNSLHKYTRAQLKLVNCIMTFILTCLKCSPATWSRRACPHSAFRAVRADLDVPRCGPLGRLNSQRSLRQQTSPTLLRRLQCRDTNARWTCRAYLVLSSTC